jgi:hypothetical protein
VAKSPAWIGLVSGAAAFLPLEPHDQQPAKGGELALELVRVGPDGQLRRPDRFLHEDRFKVLLTCPPGSRGYADVLAFQDGQTTAPLDTQRVDDCGNRRTLQGAFQLTGSSATTICVVFSASSALGRSQLPNMPNTLADDWVCQTLLPVR